MKKVTLVSTSRADFFLLKSLFQELGSCSKFELAFIAVIRPVENLSEEIKDLARSQPRAIIRTIGIPNRPKNPMEVVSNHSLLLSQIGRELATHRPELVVVLGDRSEALVTAVAASLMGIPIAHLHGGEKTIGAIDDSLRHAITKLSHLHFVAENEYANRVAQMGETRVFEVGSIGQENARNFPQIPKSDILKLSGCSLGKRNYLLTVHPETISGKPSANDLENLMSALLADEEAMIFVTGPNSDLGGLEIADRLQLWSRKSERVCYIESLGSEQYFGLARLMDAIIGNSSSGVIEIPALGKPSINIGDRQTGRLMPPTVINVPWVESEIRSAVSLTNSKGFKQDCLNYAASLGQDSVVQKISQVLIETSANNLRLKDFQDLNFTRE